MIVSVTSVSLVKLLGLQMPRLLSFGSEDQWYNLTHKSRQESATRSWYLKDYLLLIELQLFVLVCYIDFLNPRALRRRARLFAFGQLWPGDYPGGPTPPCQRPLAYSRASPFSCFYKAYTHPVPLNHHHKCLKGDLFD